MSGHSKWENIKRKKGKTDAIRARITTKISKEITIAARMGGGDPVGNMRLKLALTKAKQNNVPKENIQRAIAKGVGAASGAGFDEVTYEGYGPGGAAVIVECNTDNRNRAAADIRHAFTHHGGSVGTPGCVGWMFKKKGCAVETTVVGADKKTKEQDLSGKLPYRLRSPRKRSHRSGSFRTGYGSRQLCQARRRCCSDHAAPHR